jgi:prepilin signal peptidase PulO-like enzyme (type II secretory pathway)
MEIFMGAIVFLIGLCCGSFVNMLVYRTEIKYELKKSKFKGTDRDRSYCDFCGKQLHWYENIPVFSWLVLGGKSRCCRKKLPIQYPLVELSTGILFLFFINNYLAMIIGTLLVFEFVFDLKWMILPDFSTYILIGIAFILALVGGHACPPLLSGLGAFLFLLLIHLVTRGRGMGFGDVKLALFMGLFLGWPKIIVAFYFAFISGAIIGIGLIVSKKLKRSSQVPFGPFLIVGTVVAYLIGDSLMYYVYRWF